MAAHLLLQDTPFSRNRNFEAFDDPRFTRAIALYRRLRALLSDLERAAAAGAKDGTRVVVTEEPSRIRLDFDSRRYTRTSFVDRAAWNVLMLHPRARTLMEEMHDRTDRNVRDDRNVREAGEIANHQEGKDGKRKANKANKGRAA